MFKKTTTKKPLILLVALVLCATLLFAACNPANAFVPVEIPAEAQVEGNGGIGVK